MANKLPQSLQTLPVITWEQIEELKAQNHVVYIYPRKQIVSVDGFKKYRLESIFK